MSVGPTLVSEAGPSFPTRIPKKPKLPKPKKKPAPEPEAEEPEAEEPEAPKEDQPAAKAPPATTPGASTAPASTPAPTPAQTEPRPAAKPAAPPPAAKPQIPVGDIKDTWRPTVAPGARTIAPAAPKFCDGTFVPWKDSQYKAYTLERLPRGLWGSHSVARVACTYPDHPKVQEWIAAFRQYYENDLGLPDAVVDDVLRYSLTHDGTARKADFEKTPCEPFPVSARPGSDEAVTQAIVRSFACNTPTPSPASLTAKESKRWYMDRDPRVESAVAIAAWVDDGVYDTFDAKHVGARLWLQDELDRFSVEEALKELNSGSFTDLERLWATTRIYRAARKKAAADALFEAELSQRPDLPEILAAGREAREAWHREHAVVRGPYDAAIAYEKAWIAKDYKGISSCAETLDAQMKPFLQANKVTSLDSMTTAASTAPGYTYVSALYRCHVQSQSGRAEVYGEFIHKSDHLRGPRTAALRAGMRKSQEWLDKPGFESEITPRYIRRFLGQPEVMGANALNVHSTGYGGWVQSVQPAGDTVKVTFQRRTYQEPIYNCVSTNRIDRIKSDGKVVYKQNCTQTGSRTIDNTRDPVDLPASAATGITSGRFLVYYRSSQGAFPIAVYADDKRTKALSLLGVGM